jgi:hypothetical protein
MTTKSRLHKKIDGWLLIDPDGFARFVSTPHAWWLLITGQVER